MEKGIKKKRKEDGNPISTILTNDSGKLSRRINARNGPPVK